MRSRELTVVEFAEMKQRSRPLRTWNSPKAGKKVQQLRREHNSHQIGWRKRSGPLVSMSRKEAQEERTRRTDLNRQI
jgi:hypothetical protein